MTGSCINLIALLSVARQPDRALDCKIATRPGCGPQPIPTWVAPDGRTHVSPPNYTALIDDALTLRPKGCRWLVGDGHPYPSAWANVRSSGDALHREAATPAIALCIALLEARKNDSLLGAVRS